MVVLDSGNFVARKIFSNAASFKSSVGDIGLGGLNLPINESGGKIILAQRSDR